MNSRIQGGCLIVIVLLLAVIAFKQFNQPPVMSAASPVVYKVCLNAHGGGSLYHQKKRKRY